MGTFGSLVVDVTAARTGAMTPLTPVANDGTRSVNGALTQLQIELFPPRSPPPGGAVLYFPPGRYRVAALQPGTSLTAVLTDTPTLGPHLPSARPANLFFNAAFTLRFARGARLELDEGVLVDIQGDIDAPLSEIFRLGRGARVLLGGRRITEVFPEWWGAVGGDPDHDSSDALQACFDSATLRFDSGSPSTTLAPVRVVLGGPYYLGKGLVLGRRETLLASAPRTPQGNVRLVARQVFQNATPDRATLVAARGSTWGEREAMLRIGNGAETNQAAGGTVVGVTIEGLSFHANGRAAACVWIPTGGSKFNLLRGCAFQGAKRWQVLAGQPVIFEPYDRRAGASIEATTTNLVDLSQLLISDCSFRTRVNDDRTLSVAVLVRAANAFPVELRSCSFDGPAAAMIVGHAGTCRVRGCVFHNTASPVSRMPMADAREYPQEYREVSTPVPGTDLYVARPTTRRNVEAVPLGRILPSGQPLESASPTGFFVDQCLSRSSQFLDTFIANGSFERRTDFYPTLLRSVRHLPLRPDGAAAIRWRGPGSDPVGCSLAMLGCYLGVPAVMGSPEAGSVVLGDASRALLEISSRRIGLNALTVVVEGRNAMLMDDPLLRLIRVRSLSP